MSEQLYILMVGQDVGGNFLDFKTKIFYRSMKISALFIKESLCSVQFSCFDQAVLLDLSHSSVK